jgi:hypothetical protein
MMLAAWTVPAASQVSGPGAADAPRPAASPEPAALDEGPGGGVFRAMAVHYPDEYRTLLATLSDPALGAAEADATRNRLLTQFFARRAPALVKAPVDMLVRINAQQLMLIRRLARTDVGLCAQFARTSVAGRLDPLPALQAQVSALGASIVEAAKQGETNPRAQQPGSMAQGDAFDWYSQMLLEEPSTDFKMTRNGAGDDASGAELECRVGLATFGAIAKLPPEQAANVGASFLAQSLTEAARD